MGFLAIGRMPGLIAMIAQKVSIYSHRRHGEAER
jgi:hypothetical protein